MFKCKRYKLLSSDSCYNVDSIVRVAGYSLVRVNRICDLCNAVRNQKRPILIQNWIELFSIAIQ